MGSIPTRSRHPYTGRNYARLLIVLSVLAGLGLPGRPSAAPGSGATEADPPDSTTVGRATGFNAPFWVMMRSVAIPGWGQAHNRQLIKAILLGGTEALFIYGVVEEDRLASDAFDRGDSAGGEAHRSRKRDYIWWGAFTLLLSVGDAYVDAHLRGFRAEFRQEDQAVLLKLEVHP